MNDVPGQCLAGIREVVEEIVVRSMRVKALHWFVAILGLLLFVEDLARRHLQHDDSAYIVNLWISQVLMHKGVVCMLAHMNTL